MLRQASRNVGVGLAGWRAVAGTQYHSTRAYLEPEAAEVQQQLLNAAAKHVKQHGWSKASLIAAAKELQLSPSCAGMFPRGPSELIEHVIKQHNRELALELQASQQQFMALPVRERIATAVRRRLEMNAKYMDSWPQALSILAQPRNSPAALQLLLQLLDEIWYAAGDTSADASWYTKRALLAAVYTSTELYMLTDFSPGYQDTWQQLDRRVQDVLWLGSAAQSAAAVPQQLLDLVLIAAGRRTGSSSSSKDSSSTTAAASQAGQASPSSSAAESSSSSTGSSSTTQVA